MTWVLPLHSAFSACLMASSCELAWIFSSSNSPWAVTLAPATFGAFGGEILVGNFGDGHVNAYDPVTGHFEGRLLNASGQPLTISGLWGLRFPAGSLNAVPGALYFTAGINDERDGLFGDLVPQG